VKQFSYEPPVVRKNQTAVAPSATAISMNDRLVIAVIGSPSKDNVRPKQSILLSFSNRAT
jgi:hypothetical protein